MAKLQRRLGRVVRRLRSQAGFSQERFARRIRVHRTTMGKLENGQFNPSLDMLERLARGLGLSVSALFAEVEREGHRSRATSPSLGAAMPAEDG